MEDLVSHSKYLGAIVQSTDRLSNIVLSEDAKEVESLPKFYCPDCYKSGDKTEMKYMSYKHGSFYIISEIILYCPKYPTHSRIHIPTDYKDIELVPLK